MKDYRPNLAAQRSDPAAARVTLDSSGASPGQLAGIHLLVRDLPADRALAAYIAAQVKLHLGVDMTLDVKSSPEVTALLQTGDFQLQAPAGWLADYPDEQDFLDIFRTLQFGQWSRYSSPAFDNLVGRADVETDPTPQAPALRPGPADPGPGRPVAFLDQPLAWNLVQPYVQGAIYTSLDDWPGDLYASEISIAAH